MKLLKDNSLIHTSTFTVCATGVGTRSFPVKVIFTDEQGKSYYLPVAISKTNCGMIDNDFIMDNHNKYFLNAFSFTDINSKKSENLMELYGNRAIYLKEASTLVDKSGNSVKLPKYAQFAIQQIVPEKTPPYVQLELVTPQKEQYTHRISFVSTSTVDIILQTGNYFADIFGMGDLKAQYPEISENDWERIQRGKVRKQMGTDACRLALGDPIRIHKVNEYETWFYSNKVLQFTNKKLDGIN